MAENTRVSMIHITQSPQWAQFRLKTPNVKKVLEVDGCRIYIHRIPCLPASRAHLPWTIAYLPRPEKIANIEKIKDACEKEMAIFIKIEPVTEISNFKFQISNSVLPRHTIYIDLTQTEEEVLKNNHEKTRYNIHLAEKKDVKVTEGADLETFLDLLEKTEDRQGFYSHPRDYYKILWETLRPEKMVYLLSAGNMAAIMLLRYKDFLYYAYGGSDPKYREMMAPNLLHWEAIKLGKKLGCKIYDLWGSYKNSPTESDPWWGIYRFKKGFGGKEITFPNSIDVPLSPLYSLYPLLERFRGLTK